MNRFEPSLLDRLLGDDANPGANQTSAAHQRHTLDEVRGTVARDLELLLNTRCSLRNQMARRYQECSRSVYTFGVSDFSSMVLSSNKDRASIAASIEAAIRLFEPRLKDPVVTLATQMIQKSRIEFAIHAVLVLRPFQEMVFFDAALHPVTHRYMVQRSSSSSNRKGS